MMVNFTCNKCGESLKKKDVATHFSRRSDCRKAASLSCFDCLKDFGQDYTSHTICVTEDQRYSASGLAAGKNKQQLWTESVHQHLQSFKETNGSSLTRSMVNLLDFLLHSASVPKKEKPFINFVDNSKKFLPTDTRAAWNIVSDFAKQDSLAKANEVSKSKSITNGVTPTLNGKTHTSDKNKGSESVGASDENKLEDDKGASRDQKKKKKSKNTAESSDTVEKANEEISSDLNGSIKQKKKKEKKNESADISQITEDTPMEVQEDAGETKVEEEKLSKKEKKLKKKREKYEAEMKALEAAKVSEETAEDIGQPAVEVEKKKKKSKKHAHEVEENLETDKKTKKKHEKMVSMETDENLETDKGKKKRERTVSMAAETDHPKKKNKQKDNDENIKLNEDIEDTIPNRKDFNWGEVIVQVLQSQDDKEMSVKRLCKKVVNEYLSSLLEDAHVDELKATAKFQKKLHKTPGVFVHKDKAKLKATDE